MSSLFESMYLKYVQMYFTTITSISFTAPYRLMSFSISFWKNSIFNYCWRCCL